jgi:phosphoribosyl-ATP pyrophosphohydrolase
LEPRIGEDGGDVGDVGDVGGIGTCSEEEGQQQPGLPGVEEAAVDHAAGSQPEDARRAADAAPERATSPPARASEGGASAPAASEVIDRLERLVASRKRERPQGSYTTYLFDSGPEKIRKKTGEEAVELLLARDRKEIVSEAADFIYHLLVLLCDLEIPFSDVAAELERREEGQ